MREQEQRARETQQQQKRSRQETKTSRCCFFVSFAPSLSPSCTSSSLAHKGHRPTTSKASQATTQHQHPHTLSLHPHGSNRSPSRRVVLAWMDDCQAASVRDIEPPRPQADLASRTTQHSLHSHRHYQDRINAIICHHGRRGGGVALLDRRHRGSRESYAFGGRSQREARPASRRGSRLAHQARWLDQDLEEAILYVELVGSHVLDEQRGTLHSHDRTRRPTDSSISCNVH